MMMALFSEWGNLLSVIGSYERAHFFDNVAKEVESARFSFSKIALKMLNVDSGNHIEGMALTLISLVVTAAFLMVLPLIQVTREVVVPIANSTASTTDTATMALPGIEIGGLVILTLTLNLNPLP